MAKLPRFCGIFSIIFACHLSISARADQNLDSLRATFQSEAKIAAGHWDRRYLWQDLDSGKTISHFLLYQQFPWSAPQTGASCYAHAAAELISAAHFRATAQRQKPRMVDGDLLALWLAANDDSEDGFGYRLFKIWVGDSRFIFDGGYVGAALSLALKKHAAFVRTPKTRQVFTRLTETLAADAGDYGAGLVLGDDKIISFPENSRKNILRLIESARKRGEIFSLSFPRGKSPRLVTLWEDAKLANDVEANLQWTMGPFGERSPLMYTLWSTYSPRQNPVTQTRAENLLRHLRNYIPVAVGIFSPGAEFTRDGGKTWTPGQPGQYDRHAIVLIGLAVTNGKLQWIFRDHAAADGQSFIRFPIEESYRIYAAYALVLPGEI